jgi:DNA-binding response OmpR family regulator
MKMPNERVLRGERPSCRTAQDAASRATEEDPMQQTNRTDESTPRALRIVVAEDDGEMRALIAGGLRRGGFEVVELGNGWQLLECLARNHLNPDDPEQVVDLVISDVRMPGKSGLDVLAGLRWADWPVPVILITAFGDRHTHAEARRLGAIAVFDKPFAVCDLCTMTLNLLT